MSAPEVVLTSEEREALGDWWDSDWPDTAGGVMVTLYTAVDDDLGDHGAHCDETGDDQ
jgi:hypothetical protein